MKTFTTNNQSIVAERANEIAFKHSAGVESKRRSMARFPPLRKVQTTASASFPQPGKVQTTASASFPQPGKVQTTPSASFPQAGKVSLWVTACFPPKKMNQQQPGILIQRLIQFASELDNHFAERFPLCLSVFAFKKKQIRKRGYSPVNSIQNTIVVNF